MAEDELPNNDSHGISELLVSLVLGDASNEQVDRLNDLLQRDAAHRRFAAQFLSDEALLRQQFEMLGRVGDFHTPAAQRTEETACTVTTRADELSAAKRLRSFRGPASLLLASLLLAALIVGWWLARDAATPESLPLADHGGLRGGGTRGPVATAASKGPGALPRVERVSWAGPQFASKLKPGPIASPMARGVVTLNSADGQIAKGYMIELPPGALLELVVTADAGAENALAVTEFDSVGRPTGRKMSFTNNFGESSTTLALRDEAPSSVRYGPLGNWAERNTGPESLYYLFTCVHQHVAQSSDSAWHISRMSVLLDEPDLMHIGWDDSGMFSGEGEPIPDDDYDDLSATIRIVNPSAPDDATERLRILSHAADVPEGVQDTAPRARAPLEFDLHDLLAGEQEHGFELSVGAHEVVILKVNNRAPVPVSMTLVDKQTGSTKWSCEHLEPRLVNTGFCVVQNDTSQPRQFLLLGWRKTANADLGEPWRPASFSVVFEQDTFETLQLHVRSDEAPYHIVKVDVLKLSNP